jgi:hypothetical protein
MVRPSLRLTYNAPGWHRPRGIDKAVPKAVRSVLPVQPLLRSHRSYALHYELKDMADGLAWSLVPPLAMALMPPRATRLEVMTAWYVAIKFERGYDAAIPSWRHLCRKMDVRHMEKSIWSSERRLLDRLEYRIPFRTIVFRVSHLTPKVSSATFRSWARAVTELNVAECCAPEDWVRILQVCERERYDFSRAEWGAFV